MPTTTNVSQIDQHEARSRHEFQSVSTDPNEKPILLMANMEDDNGNDVDDDNNISRTPPIDVFSMNSNEGGGPKEHQ